MSCHNREQDLLLLLHGELALGRRLRLQAHLRRCSRCRQRQEKLLDVSRLIAGAVRAPDMPPWVIVRSRRSLPRLRSPYAVLILLLALLGGMLLYTTSGHGAHHHHVLRATQQTPTSVNVSKDPCR